MLFSPAVLRRAEASCLDSLLSACCSVSDERSRAGEASKLRQAERRAPVRVGGRRTDPVSCLRSRTNKSRKSTVTIAKSSQMLLEFSSMGLSST